MYESKGMAIGAFLGAYLGIFCVVTIVTIQIARNKNQFWLSSMEPLIKNMIPIMKANTFLNMFLI